MTASAPGLPLADWRERALPRSIAWVLVLGGPVAVFTAWLVWDHDPAGLLSPQYLSMMGVFVSLLALRFARLPYRARAVGFVVTVCVMATLAFLNFGLAPGPPIAFCLATLIAGVFLGSGALMLTLVVTAACVVLSGLVLTSGTVQAVSPTFVANTMLHWNRAALEYFFFSGSVAAIVYVLIVELERREAAAAQAQRLEAVGRLAGGVAHDFNNALQVIFSEVEWLRRSKDPRVQAGADSIQTASENAERVTAQLLAFGRRDVLRPQELRLGTEVRTWIEAARRRVPSSVLVQLDLRADPLVFCDRGQLDQILRNLFDNAQESMNGAGRVLITVGEDVRHHVPARAQESIAGLFLARLEIRDTGRGMTSEAQGRIFEPFYTTKEAFGSGLGLATVYGATLRAGGIIDVESAPGEGSTFTIYLPVVAPATRAAQ